MKKDYKEQSNLTDSVFQIYVQVIANGLLYHNFVAYFFFFFPLFQVLWKCSEFML